MEQWGRDKKHLRGRLSPTFQYEQGVSERGVEIDCWCSRMSDCVDTTPLIRIRERKRFAHEGKDTSVTATM